VADSRTTTRREGPDLPLRQVGPYQLLAIVGAGDRAGTVFLARRQGIDRNFAVKVLPPGQGAEAEARTLREARLASRLEHPGVARVLEVDRHQDRLYVVMEHVPGPTLRDHVDKGGPMPSADAALLMAEVADALAAVHAAGIVHRDVSAPNVVLDDRSGRPRLVDFGLARELDGGTDVTRAGQTLGSPEESAPEQVRGERVDARADIYGVGLILYELLTATRPFEGGTPADVCRRVLSEERPARPSKVVRGVSRAVEAVCLRAMALRPADRFASAAEVAAALRAAAAGRGASGRATRGEVAALSVALVASLVAIGWLLALVRDARADVAARQAALAAARARLAAAEVTAAKAEAAGASAARALGALTARREELARERGERAEARARAALRARQLSRAAAQPDEGVARVVDALTRWLEPHAAAATLRAGMLYDRGRPDLALDLARARGDALLELRCLVALKRHEEVRELIALHLREAPERSDERGFARLLTGDYAGLEAVPPDGATPLVVAAADLAVSNGLRAGDPRLIERGRVLAEAAVRQAPTSVEALYSRSSANYHLWLVTKDAALIPRYMADLYRARALNPQAAFWVYAGKSFVMNDRPIEALSELEVGVDLADRAREPGLRALARAWYGAALAQLGQGENALMVWLDAVQLAPEHSTTYDFFPWAGRLAEPLRRRLLAGVPPARRRELEQALVERN
jgi:serine/threonine-protein kinase